MRRDSGTAANEFRARVFGRGDDQLIAFVCECGDPTCHRTVMLTAGEYSARRPGLLIHESHEDEDLIEQTG